MGYMGLESLWLSDYAADWAVNDLLDELAKKMKKHIKEEDGNEYNTCGLMNVCMFFMEVITPNPQPFLHSDKTLKLAKKIVKKELPQLIKDMKEAKRTAKETKGKEWDSADEHIKAAQRWLRNIQAFTEKDIECCKE